MGSTLTVDNIVGATTAANVKLPAGCVVQTVQFHRRGQQDGSAVSSLASMTTSTYVDVMSKSITTKFANSLIYVAMNLVLYDNSGNALRGKCKILRNSTEIDGDSYFGYAPATARSMYQNGFNFLDTPSAAAGTTLTYKMQGGETGSSTAHFGYGDSSGGSSASIVLMEIAQ